MDALVNTYGLLVNSDRLGSFCWCTVRTQTTNSHLVSS